MEEGKKVLLKCCLEVIVRQKTNEGSDAFTKLKVLVVASRALAFLNEFESDVALSTASRLECSNTK